MAEPSIPDLYDDEEEDDEPTRGGGAAVRKVRLEAVDEPTGLHRLFEMTTGARTDPGTKRTNNEDAMLLLEEEALYVVADGMGGHEGGEVASQLAVEAIAATFLDPSREQFLLSNVPPRAIQLVQGFAAANEAIRSAASRTPWLSEMGTTVVAMRFCPNKGRAYIGHVGDSRCYRLRDGRFEQMTNDHTLAEYGVTGRDSHRLSRAVGSNGIVEADIVVVEPREGDVFLLCSDGLNKAMQDNAMHEILEREISPEQAAAELIACANKNRARDNVTALVVRIDAPSKA